MAQMNEAQLNEDVRRAFDGALKNLVGAKYTPVLYCGSQVVNGTNYMLICKQGLATAPHVEHLVKLTINVAPTTGDCSILSIDTIF